MPIQWIVIVGLVAFAGLLWAQDKTDSGVSIHKPLRYPTKRIPYAPERIIRMTLHDYVGGGMGGQEHGTRGRYVTFGLPMQYLVLINVFPDQTPLDIQTEAAWEPGLDGAPGAIVNIHDPNGHRPVSILNSTRFRARATPFGHRRFSRRSPQLVSARQSGAAFDGYKMIPELQAQTFWLGETYCGFDVFERDDPRYWQLEAGTVENVDVPEEIRLPFDHARVFGWPDGDGEYRFCVECKYARGSETVFCATDRAYNDYITVTYTFDGSLLCQIDGVVDAHLDLLRRSVVDEQTVKNEKWRRRSQPDRRAFSRCQDAAESDSNQNTSRPLR